MIVGATAYERKGDLRDKTRKLTLTAETEAEAAWLAAIYRAFRLGESMPGNPPGSSGQCDMCGYPNKPDGCCSRQECCNSD